MSYEQDLLSVKALNTFNILFSASLETLTFNTSQLTAVETDKLYLYVLQESYEIS